MTSDIRLFTGTANPTLATAVARTLNRHLDPIEVTKFSDGEIRVEIGVNVRKTQSFIIQPTCAPTNDNLMELLLIADALRRSSADEVIAVVPYFGYARQDRRPGYSRVPISASVAAKMMESVGINHLVTVDLHATQIQGFFQVPVDNISATNLIAQDIHANYGQSDPIIISPDVGGVARARQVAKHPLCSADLGIIDKRRKAANVAEVMNIIGNVSGRTCVIVDDMVDTAGTLAKAADALMNEGAARVIAYATHGVLSGAGVENVNSSLLSELVITDTIPMPTQESTKLRSLTVASVLGGTIERIASGQSLRELLD